MSKTIIHTNHAPAAIGAYSQAVRSGVAVFNEVMAEYFTQPYPARAAIGVAALPKGVQVEADAVLVLDL